MRTATVSIDNTGPPNGDYVTRPATALCSSGELAISAGTGWSDDSNDLELFTGRITPVLNTTNQVVGFRAVGGNDGAGTSTFTVYALCYRA